MQFVSNIFAKKIENFASQLLVPILVTKSFLLLETAKIPIKAIEHRTKLIKHGFLFCGLLLKMLVAFWYTVHSQYYKKLQVVLMKVLERKRSIKH